MPYIANKTRRSELDEIIMEMNRWGVKPDGDLNYILFAYAKRSITPSYNNYKNYIGELEECIAEIRRRLLGPYEDKKIEENGDVE